jgi:hypothetical protein
MQSKDEIVSELIKAIEAKNTRTVCGFCVKSRTLVMCISDASSITIEQETQQIKDLLLEFEKTRLEFYHNPSNELLSEQLSRLEKLVNEERSRVFPFQGKDFLSSATVLIEATTSFLRKHKDNLTKIQRLARLIEVEAEKED